VPDYRKAGFKDECRRQSLLLSNDESEIRELAWGEEMIDRTGWI
jgi:hypothetical protein